MPRHCTSLSSTSRTVRLTRHRLINRRVTSVINMKKLWKCAGLKQLTRKAGHIFILFLKPREVCEKDTFVWRLSSPSVVYKWYCYLLNEQLETCGLKTEWTKLVLLSDRHSPHNFILFRYVTITSELPETDEMSLLKLHSLEHQINNEFIFTVSYNFVDALLSCLRCHSVLVNYVC